MIFLSSQFLWILIFIPVYLGLFLWQKKIRSREKAIIIPVFDDLEKARKKTFNWQIFEYLVFILIIVLFAISLARPQDKHEKQKTSKKGIDIIIALDVSASMTAEDLKPNRMEAAKENIEKFISKLENDRLGIIVFAGQAFTQSPLTFDYNILKEYLKTISPDSINQRVNGLNGTAVGDAILAAVNRFKDSKNRSKVLVLLTDGDANTGVEPELAAMKAKKENIKIYTIGIGKKGGAPMPVVDALGRKTYAHNRDGSLFMAVFNEDNLKKIAQITNGNYFRADDNEKFLQIMKEINNLEKRDIEVNISTEYTENFMKYLMSLYFLFLIYLLLSVFRNYQI